MKAYGEFEFWFASIKVAAIVAFICLALAYVFGLTGGEGGVSQLTAEGGFAPEGFGKLERDDPERREVRMWGYPWLTYLVIVAIVVVIGSMAFVDDVRSQLWWSLGSLAVVLGAYALRSRAMSGRRGRSGSAAAELPARPPSGRGRAPRPAARRP